MRRILDDKELNRKAPSIFAGGASTTTSSKYAFLPTIEVVRALKAEGWHPVDASEQRCRNTERKGHQKHLIRFQRQGETALTDSRFELLLVNAHDGGSSYQLHAGIFRMACANGLIVADSQVDALRVRHIGEQDIGNVIEATSRVVERVPAIEEKVQQMQGRTLHRYEEVRLAQAGRALRFENPEEVSAHTLLTPRRSSDQLDNLWIVHNRVQEAIMRGRATRVVRKEGKRPEVKRARKVKGIDSELRINRKLWEASNALLQGGDPMEVVKAN